jgi:hypothetical protein
MTTTLLRGFAAATIPAPACCTPPRLLPARAVPPRSASASRRALNELYARTPAAKTLGAKARGILVFRRSSKAASIFGGEFGRRAAARRQDERLLQHDRRVVGTAGLRSTATPCSS